LGDWSSDVCSSDLGIMEKTIISAKNVAVEKTPAEDDTAVRAAVIFA